jgi:Formyl transferase
MSFASQKKKIAVLISGRGSNLEAILKAIEENALPATVSIVISNRAFCEAAGFRDGDPSRNRQSPRRIRCAGRFHADVHQLVL